MNKGRVNRLEEKLKKAKGLGKLIIMKKFEEPYTCNGEEFNTLEEIKQKYNLRNENDYMLIRVRAF